MGDTAEYIVESTLDPHIRDFVKSLVKEQLPEAVASAKDANVEALESRVEKLETALKKERGRLNNLVGRTKQLENVPEDLEGLQKRIASMDLVDVNDEVAGILNNHQTEINANRSQITGLLRTLQATMRAYGLNPISPKKRPLKFRRPTF